MAPIMNKIFRRVEYWEVEYGDLEQLIGDTYGKEFSVISALCCGNDTMHSVRAQNCADKWEKREIQDWLDGGHEEIGLHGIFSDMCEKGLLEAGDYLVNVYW